MRAPASDRPARDADALVDVTLVAFAAWTLVYHACVVLGVRAPWALLAWAIVALPACVVVADRRDGAADDPPPDAEAPPAPATAGAPIVPVAPGARASWALLAGNLVLAALAAALFAFGHAPWALVCLLWVLAAGLSVAGSIRRPDRAVERRAAGASAWTEPAVAVLWAVALAGLSAFVVAPDRDDAYYVHLSTWIGAHGDFPVRDVVFSDEIFPSLYYPPIPSYEALVGAIAHLTGLPAGTITYLVVPPLGTALAVLTLWRLLRAWRTPAPALALSVALVFLLFAATHHNALGAFFLGRMWQGKVLLLCIIVPLAFALLHDAAERPTPRRLTLLAAAGVAGVGLSTSAAFVLPALAAGAMAPMALRSARRAAAGFAALAAYPLAASAVTLALGGRTPDVYTDRDVIASKVAHLVLDRGTLAAVALFAALAGPSLVPRRSAAGMVAGVALLVGILYAPDVPRLIFHATGLGRVLWRLIWAVPVAALVGALAVAPRLTTRPGLVRAALAATACAVVVAAGAPLWRAGGEAWLAPRPQWKRTTNQLSVARRIDRLARPGDVVLLPHGYAVTLLAVSAKTTLVSPRGFYTKALRDIPAAHARDRRTLQRLVEPALREPPPAPGKRRRRKLRRVLRDVGVDIACVRRDDPRLLPTLRGAGFAPLFQTRRLRCLHAPRVRAAARQTTIGAVRRRAGAQRPAAQR